MRPDEGGGGPTLNPKAKQYERELFKVFSVQTGSISMTQTDWQNAKKQLEALAKDVRAVHGELEAPADGSKGWSGPAAVAALGSLNKLSETLDTHAGEIGNVDTSLGQVYTAVSDARSEWYAKVAIISTYVDPDAHKRLPAPYLPTADNAAKYSIRDPEAAAAAEDAKWEERNQAAKKVLEQLALDTQAAKGTMPIDVKDDKETPYNNQGPAANNHTSGTATNGGNAGRPTGSVVGPGFQPNPVIDTVIPDDTGLIPVIPPEEPIPVIEDPVDPLPPPVDFDPISSDGDPTGSTELPTGTGPGGSQAGFPSGGGPGGTGVGAGGVAAGGVGGAAGLGSLLGKRPGGMFSSGGSAKGGSASGRATGGGAGTRGSAMRSGGARPGGSQMVPGGGGSRSGGAARGGGGAAGRGSAVKGSTGSGKYGVPKVGGKGTGGVPAGGAGQGGKGAGKAGGRGTGGRGTGGASAAGRGGARKGDKNQPQDVDKLTHEDEEKWFEGTEESSPQVWD